MVDVPDAWPPKEPRRTVVPLFPLPNAFLFPGQVMPLNVFEPRYRQMVEDCLDGPGRIVMGTVTEEHREDLSGTPPVSSVGGLGEIARHEKQDDGRYLIWLVGLTRCHIREVDSDRPYRRVEAEPVREIAPNPREARSLRKRLGAALSDRGILSGEPRGERPVSQLADLLLMSLNLPPDRRGELYSTLSVSDRARGVLTEHERLPPAPEDDPD